MAAPSNTASGLDPNLAGALAYVFGWVTGLIIFLTEPNNKYVRFHALQSIFLSIAIFVIYVGLGMVLTMFAIVPGLNVVFTALGALIYFLVGIGVFVLWIVLMVRAYQGEKFKLPVIGDMAEQNA